MGSRKRYARTKQRPPSLGDPHRAELLELLRMANAREKELLRQLAEKDAQIRLVLEERFFHPIVTPSAEPRKAQSPIEPDVMVDVARFSPDKDAELLRQEDDAIEKGRARLEEELNGLIEEDAAVHEGLLPQERLVERPTAEEAEEQFVKDHAETETELEPA